uniref:Uncharacterized protein n=1 Tax=Rhizophora mucronata TaxID=61149 RepID=A0A2P2JXN0_RHIMU
MCGLTYQKITIWDLYLFTLTLLMPLAANCFHGQFLHDIWAWISSKHCRCYCY